MPPCEMRGRGGSPGLLTQKGGLCRFIQRLQPTDNRCWCESSPRGHSLTSLQNPNALFSKGPQRHSVPEGGGLLKGTPPRTGAPLLASGPRGRAPPTALRACLCCCPTWCSRSSSHLLIVSGTVSSAGPLPWAPPVPLCPVWSPGLPPRQGFSIGTEAEEAPASLCLGLFQGV